MKLNFVCIGAQKAGTTSLHDILRSHPDIFLPKLKEAQFFDINEMYVKGVDFYFNTFFKEYNGEKLIGNINPNLQLEDRSIERLISNFGKELKFIFVLRNPVDRAFSHYLMSKKRGYENLEFLDAIQSEEERIKNPSIFKNYLSQEPGHYEKNHLGYIYRSKYLEKIRFLESRVEKKNLKIILFEDLVTMEHDVILDILDFLDIPSIPQLNLTKESNKASKPRSLLVRNFLYNHSNFKKRIGSFLPTHLKEDIKKSLDKINSKPLTKNEKSLGLLDRKFLYDNYFKDEISQLEQHLNISLDHWKPNGKN